MFVPAFTARKQDKSNLLNWTTANETNVDQFIVERSANGSPDSHREFSKIGTVKAGTNNYSFTDNTPLKATNYYRLKMLDKDGQLTYSPIRMINNSGTFSINIYPNPAKDNLQIQIDSDRKTTLQLKVLSMDGKAILSNSVDAKEGSILRSINISALSKGTYFLKVLSLNPLLENPPLPVPYSLQGEGREAQVVKFEKQ